MGTCWVILVDYRHLTPPRDWRVRGCSEYSVEHDHGIHNDFFNIADLFVFFCNAMRIGCTFRLSMALTCLIVVFHVLSISF